MKASGFTLSHFTKTPNLPDERSVRPGSRPQAVVFINDQSFAGVCAWCAGKKEADDWCRERRLRVTHTICPTCRERLKDEHEAEYHRWVA